MSSENKRLFFAVNIPAETKREIAESVLPLIPEDGWKKVLPENLHITMHFLGHLPKDAVSGLLKSAGTLEAFEAFEAEINCAGHFKGRVLWLGIGKGTDEFRRLNRKLQEAIGTHDDKFHAHLTLARNRGAKKEQAQKLVEDIRKKLGWKTVQVKSLELMESQLRKPGPKYSVLFSLPFSQAAE